MKMFEEVACRLVESPLAHARFANTLSFLEYRGARKILKSQKAEAMSAELLSHVAEEIRHAQIFKRLALKLSNDELVSYRREHLLCGSDANAYFQGIDEAGADFLKMRGERQNYLLTTLLIEERATAIYPVYRRILDQSGVPNTIEAVIRDEDAHLESIRLAWEGLRLPPATLETLRGVEYEKFSTFMEAISAEMSLRVY